MPELRLPDETLLHQLAITEVEQMRMEEKPINYRRGKNTKQASMVRILCAQANIADENTLIDELIKLAFYKMFERTG